MENFVLTPQFVAESTGLDSLPLPIHASETTNEDIPIETQPNSEANQIRSVVWDFVSSIEDMNCFSNIAIPDIFIKKDNMDYFCLYIKVNGEQDPVLVFKSAGVWKIKVFVKLTVTLDPSNFGVHFQSDDDISFQKNDQDLFHAISNIILLNDTMPQGYNSLTEIPMTPTTSMYDYLANVYGNSPGPYGTPSVVASPSPLPLTPSRFKIPAKVPTKVSPSQFLSVNSFSTSAMAKAFDDFINFGRSGKRKPMADQRLETLKSHLSTSNFEALQEQYVDKECTITGLQFFCNFICMSRETILAVFKNLNDLKHIFHTQPQELPADIGIEKTTKFQSRSFRSEFCLTCARGSNGLHYKDFLDESNMTLFFYILESKTSFAGHSVRLIYDSLSLLHRQMTEKTRFISPFAFARRMPQTPAEIQCANFLNEHSINFPETFSSDEKLKFFANESEKIKQKIAHLLATIEEKTVLNDPFINPFGIALEEQAIEPYFFTLHPDLGFCKILQFYFELGWAGKHGFKQKAQSDPSLYNQIVKIIEQNQGQWIPFTSSDSLARFVTPTEEGTAPFRHQYPFAAYTTPLMSESKRMLIGLHFQHSLVDGDPKSETPRKIHTRYRIMLVDLSKNPAAVETREFENRHNFFVVFLLLIGYPSFFIFNQKLTQTTEAPLLKGLVRLVNDRDGYVSPPYHLFSITMKTKSGYISIPAGDFWFNPKSGKNKPLPETSTPKKRGSPKNGIAERLAKTFMGSKPSSGLGSPASVSSIPVQAEESMFAQSREDKIEIPDSPSFYQPSNTIFNSAPPTPLTMDLQFRTSMTPPREYDDAN